MANIIFELCILSNFKGYYSLKIIKRYFQN